MILGLAAALSCSQTFEQQMAAVLVVVVVVVVMVGIDRHYLGVENAVFSKTGRHETETSMSSLKS